MNQIRLYGPARKRGRKRKITTAQDIQLRNDFVRGKMTIEQLATKYKVCQDSIYRHLNKPITHH